MSGRPWMPLYVGNYLADTQHLTAEQHGAYLLLLMHHWQLGKLPSDDGMLCRIARVHPPHWPRVRRVLAPFFDVTQDPGFWVQKRVVQEITKAAEISSKRKAAALQKHSKSKASAGHLHTQSQSQSQREEDKTGLRPADDVSREAPLIESPAAVEPQYEFEGAVIKLRKKNFVEWVRAYPALDIRGELTARDAWLASDRANDADRRNWFISTSKYLANRNMEARAKSQKAPEFKWRSGIEGVV